MVRWFWQTHQQLSQPVCEEEKNVSVRPCSTSHSVTADFQSSSQHQGQNCCWREMSSSPWASFLFSAYGVLKGLHGLFKILLGEKDMRKRSKTYEVLGPVQGIAGSTFTTFSKQHFVFPLTFPRWQVALQDELEPTPAQIQGLDALQLVFKPLLSQGYRPHQDALLHSIKVLLNFFSAI